MASIEDIKEKYERYEQWVKNRKAHEDELVNELERAIQEEDLERVKNLYEESYEFDFETYRLGLKVAKQIRQMEDKAGIKNIFSDSLNDFIRDTKIVLLTYEKELEGVIQKIYEQLDKDGIGE